MIRDFRVLSNKTFELSLSFALAVRKPLGMAVVCPWYLNSKFSFSTSSTDTGNFCAHQFMTSSDLEKNLCPPMSIRLPSKLTVLDIPPI